MAEMLPLQQQMQKEILCMYNDYPPYGGYQNNAPQGGYPYGFVPAPDDARRRLRTAEKRNIRRLGCVAGCCVLGFVVIGFFIGMLLDRETYERYLSDFSFQYAFDAVYSILAVGIPFFTACLFLRKKTPSELLPLGEPRNKLYFILIIPAAWLMCILGSYATTAISVFFEQGLGVVFELPGSDLSPETVPQVLLMIFRISVIPAIFEEVAMRGVVMQTLRRYGDWFAILMSASVFALMHGNMVQIPFAFIAGIAIGYAVITTGTLWTGIIIHFLNNSLSVVQTVAYNVMPEETFNVFSRVLIISVGVLGLICGIVLYEKKMFKRLHSGSRALTNAEKTGAFFLNVPMLLAIAYLVFTTMEYISF